MLSITGIDESKRFSSVSSLSFVTNGDLMALGDDYAQFASVVEYANQKYDIDLHPRTLNTQGSGWVGHTGTEGEGSRNRYALGLETRWPLTKQINLTVAGRYDKYDDATSVDDAWTYNLGFEYRPTDSLLIRAANSSNFRAPDMHYVFAATGGSYQGSAVFQQTHANKNLEEETGYTSSLGVVYQPMDQLSFSIDFYQIDLENLIEVHNGYAIALTYQECNNGQSDYTFGGYDCEFVSTPVSYDNGQTFIDRVSIVNGRYVVQVEPINTAKLKQTGVDTSFKYTWVTDKYGVFNITANHTNVLKSERQLLADSSVNTNWRNDPLNPDLRSRFRATTSWQKGDWQVALLTNRIGSLNSQQRRESWTLYNLTGIYSINNELDIQLSIQNLTDEYPRYGTSSQFPFFNAQHYNALGRQWFLEARYTY
jgi:outer membrane receptor protein involved in Fe transport